MLGNIKFSKFVVGLLGVSFCFFLVDSILDIADHIATQRAYNIDELIHIFFELLATAALGLGILFMRSYLTLLNERHQQAQTSLTALRSDFDNFIGIKFDNWHLSDAERDVAFLLLRGVTINDISSFRNTSVGTVKAQCRNIFKKSGVSSRVDFMSLFMEEFIEIGLSSASEENTTKVV